MLILPETSAQDTIGIQKRITELFGPTLERYQEVGLAIGFGIAESEGKSIEEIMQVADDHLYRNKEAMKRMISV
jgi:GGDEF domain-containing protein